MNKTLKFSWGHILMFLALIVVCYLTFVGFAYMTDGNFFFAITGMVLTLLMYVIIFIGAQVMKGSGDKISRKIIWERIFIFCSPLVYAGGMVAISHFWGVKSHDAELVETFKSSIGNSAQLFSDYKTYSDGRILNYSRNLDKIISERNSNPELYSSAGFIPGRESMQKENMVRTLRLQLRSNNFDSLENLALRWIEKADAGATTWNVFLMGNTHEIKRALEDWEKTLTGFSVKKMSNEELLESVPEFKSGGAFTAGTGLDSMTATFTRMEHPVWTAILFAIIIYFFLLLPYLLQQRHGRQIAMGYSLFGKRKSSAGTLQVNDVPPVMREDSNKQDSSLNQQTQPLKGKKNKQDSQPTPPPDDDPFGMIRLD